MKLLKEHKRDTLLIIGVIFSLSAIIVILGDIINRNDLNEVSIWIIDFRVQFILNIIIIMAMSIISIIFRNIGVGGLITGGIYLSLCIANYYKSIFKGEFLSIYDIKLIGEGLNIIKGYDIVIEPHILLCVIIFLSINILALKLKFKITVKNTIIVFLVATSISLVFVNTVYFNRDVLNKLEVKNDILFDKENYIENGLALTLVTKINETRINKPKDYSAENVYKIADKYYKKQADNFIKPNVIMVMNEAFFDITDVKGISFNEDPLMNFHKYQSENIRANMVSPVFAGFTAQTEYETLTGNSVDLVGASNIAYINYVKNNMDSLGRIFSEQGYQTLAIHPYLRDFYKRDTVYNKLNFSKFISEEEIERNDSIGRYISDRDTYVKLIEEFEKKQNGQPIFSHIVTMQNHAPYNSSSNQEFYPSEFISQRSMEQVSGYINGLKESDKALKYLIDYFENIEEPTIIVFYGDHAPFLEDFYIESNTTTQSKFDTMQALELYTVPLLIWSNYSIEERDYNYLDTSYLSSIILDLIGLNSYTYYQIQEEMMKELRAYNTNFLIDKNNRYVMTENMKIEQKDLLNELWILQYDRVFGENYLKRKDYE